MDEKEIKDKFNLHPKTLINYFIIIIFILQILDSQSFPNITMKIRGYGTVNLFSHYYYFNGVYSYYYQRGYPYKINVDGVEKFGIKEKIVFDEMKVHEIKMFWNESISTCNYMFYKNENITELDLSNFDTSEVTGMYSMFKYCFSLTSINLNNINVKLVSNVDYMFSECTNLTSLNLPYLNFENLKQSIHMFSYCSNLKTINLSHLNAPSLSSIINMFYGCKSLVSLDLSYLNTPSLSSIEYMFYECESLVSVDLSNFNANSLISMQGMFSKLNKLTNLNLSKLNCPLLTNMANMFTGCTSLVSLDLSNLNFFSLKSMKSMFSGCSNLEILNLSNISVPSLNTMEKMFIGCKKLTSLNIFELNFSSLLTTKNMFENSGLLTLNLSNINVESIIEMEGMFTGSDLSSLNLSNLNFPYLKSMKNMFSDCSNLEMIDLSNINVPALETMEKMFYGCISLKSINISNLNFPKLVTMSEMLSGCINLLTFDLFNINAQKLENFEYMLNGCSNLIKLNLSNLIFPSLLTMENLLSNCFNLLSVDLSNLNTPNLANMDSMLNKCHRLISINLSNLMIPKAENLNNLFYDCSSLQELDLSKIHANSISSMENMFYGCISLISLDLSNNNIISVITMKKMFYNCSNITIINLNGLNAQNLEIMQEMFSNCISLTYLIISNFNAPKLSNINKIFYNCLSLDNLNLSNFNSTQLIKMESMFYNCKSLENLDISNLYTANINSMKEVFYGCISIKSLNLSNFITENVITMEKMFYQCISLKKILLNSFDTKNLQVTSYMFYGCHSLELLNLSSFTTSETTNMVFMFYNCKNLKILDISKFDFSNLFYGNDLSNGWLFFIYGCPKLEFINMKYSVESNINNYQNIIGNIKIGSKFCLNSNLVPQIQKIIIDSDGIIECPLENNSSPQNCFYYYYYDKNEKEYKCTEEPECPKEHHLLIKDKSECLSDCKLDKKYKYEFHGECYELCPSDSSEFIDGSFLCIYSNNSDTNNEQNDIKKIENIYLNYIKSNNFENLELETKKIIYKYKNVTFEITGTKNEKLDKNSTLVISNDECELKLKKKYNISLDEQLYFFKIITPENGRELSNLKYTYFYPLNGKKDTLVELNISICQTEKVKIYNKINITKDIDIYNISGNYYNSICHITDNEKYDLILKDRKDIYFNNNLSVCQVNCIFIEYDNENQAALCSCEIKFSNNNIEVDFSSEKLLQKVKDVNSYMNLNVMSCFKILFSIKGIIDNIGFYFFMILIIICGILLILFWKKESYIFITDIDKIYLEKIIQHQKDIKKDDLNHKVTQNENNIIKLNKNKKRKIKRKISKIGNENKRQKNNKNKKFIHLMNKEVQQEPKENTQNIKGSITNYSFLKNSMEKNILENIDLSKINNNLDKNLKKVLEMNEAEINILSYEEAYQLDKRNYLQYYFSLIMTNHPIIFTFFYEYDYNPKYIKKYLFFYNFGVYYFVNTLFFTDSTMHKIYLDEGSYNLIYQIPQIIYSNAISAFFNIFIKILALSESSILKFKQEKKFSNLNKRAESLKISLKARFKAIFILSFISLLFFWFYISCFCATYKNTQIHLIKDTIISFVSSLFTPFGIYVLPCIFRIPSLKTQKKSGKYLYGLSKILQLI